MKKFLVSLIIIITFVFFFTASLQADNNTWYAMKNVPTAPGNGGCLVGFHNNQYIWVLISGTSNAFYRYNTGNDAWDAMADCTYAGVNAVNRNSAICWGGGANIYAFRGQGGTGNNNKMSRYSIAGNSWDAANNFITLARGAAMAMNSGGRIFAHPGKSLGTNFKRSDEGVPWINLPAMPANANNGSDLVWGGGNWIYATEGKGNNGFFRFNVSNDAWDATWNANSGPNVGNAGSLCWDGSDYIYAVAGGSTDGFWKFNISDNSWAQLNSLPWTIGSAGNYCGSRISYNNNNVWCINAEGNNRFYRYEFVPTAPPSVITQDATTVTNTAARLNLSFTTGVSADVKVYFEYRTGAEEWTTTTKVVKDADGTHYEDISNLNTDTPYEFIAYLNYPPQDYGTTINGDTKTFKTLVGGNFLENNDFNGGWVDEDGVGHPTDWFWGHSGWLEEDADAPFEEGKTDFHHEPDNTYQDLYQTDETMVAGRTYYVGVWAKGTGRIKLAVVTSDGDHWLSTFYTDFNGEGWKDMTYSYENAEVTSTGGIRIRSILLSGAGEELVIGAAYLSDMAVPSGWVPTLVGLTDFQALSYERDVWLWWETATELHNAGFNIYRSENRDGPYTKLNPSLIPGLGYSVIGKIYSYLDSDVIDGRTYYYKLEAVDFFGEKEKHGPVWATPGVDSDDDGIPDGWEERYGLNPYLNDGGLDPDDDSFTNYEEFLNDTNPFIPDIEGVTPPRPPEEPSVKGEGIEIIESSESGVTLELTTDEFKEEERIEESITYQRVSIPGYIHGHSSEIGKPQVPMKGVLLGVPTDSSIEISILDTESTTFPDYNLYPVPAQEAKESGDIKYVAEIFTKDEAAYTSNDFYPDNLAELGFTGYMRDQKVVQIKIYPIQFNPVTQELKFYKKIRIRLDFSEVDQLASSPVHRFTDSPLHLSLFTTPAWADSSPSSLPTFHDSTYKLYLDYDYEEPGLYKGPQEGIYKLTYDYLQANTDIDLDSLDPRTFKIYSYNNESNEIDEIPIYVSGEDDESFNPGDYIEFYGKIEPTKYTSTNVYWLDSGGTPDGLRMDTRECPPDTADTPSSFLSTEYYERDQSYLYGVTGTDDRWLFNQTILGNQLRNFSISLTDLSASPDGDAKVKAAFRSFYNVIHHTVVFINGYEVEDATWSGRVEHSVDKSISQEGHLDEDNTLTIQVILDSGVANDRVYANWFEVDYWRDFKANNNILSFNYTNAEETEVTKLFEVSNFDDSNIEVFDIFDITDENNVKKITNPGIEGSNPYTLKFKDTIPAETNYKYLALVTSGDYDQTKEPSSISKYTDSGIYSTANGADYIVITYDDFYDENDPNNPIVKLKNHRAAQGLRVEVVKIKDVYDEFNYGIFSPQAIKDFLTHTYTNWTKPSPTYVLLVGDGHYDYHDNLGNGITNYIPPYLSETDYIGETANENWFVCVSGSDSIPDMYLGRLPVKTTAKLEIVINKILNYENTAYTNTWEKNILYVDDDADRIGETIFETTSNSVSNYPPSNYQSTPVHLSSYPSGTACRDDIVSAINNGALIVNYMGHGARTWWADEKIFQTSDIDDYLSNKEKLSFFIDMACWDGYFFHPTSECLAEELLKAQDKGAIAVLSSTGVTSSSEQKILDEGLFKAFFGGTTNIIGNAMVQAKASLFANSSNYEDVASTFGLLGDPASGLKFPPGEDGHTHGHTCPIATTTYGTSMAEEVEVFRNFRDECLLTNRRGKALVRFYYKHSSPISRFIEKKKALKPIIRAGLKPILWLARRATRPPHKYPIWE